MTNRNKAKGDKFERDVRDALTALGVNVTRTLNAGIPADVGDLLTPSASLQCKAVREWRLAEWMDATEDQAARTSRLPVVVVKRSRRPAADAYAVLPLWVLADVLNKLGDRA